MCMPGSASTRLERHARATHTRRLRRLKQRFDFDAPREPVCWPFAGLSRFSSLYFHPLNLALSEFPLNSSTSQQLNPLEIFYLLHSAICSETSSFARIKRIPTVTSQIPSPKITRPKPCASILRPSAIAITVAHPSNRPYMPIALESARVFTIISDHSAIAPHEATTKMRSNA